MNNLNITNAVAGPEKPNFDLESFVDSVVEDTDQVKGGSVFEGDIKEAEKIKVADAQEFFGKSDKKTDLGVADVVTDTSPDSDVVSNEENFTINEPEKLKEKREPVDFKAIMTKDLLAKPEPEKDKKNEVPLSPMEMLHLQAKLADAIAQYTKLVAEVVRLKNDLESKGGQNGEISRAKIIEEIEAAALEDLKARPRVRDRMLNDLIRRLKNEDSKKETEEYEKKLNEIEPAKTRISDTLDAVLANTFTVDGVGKIQKSMNNVVDDDITSVNKQEWDVACIARKDEIVNLPKVSKEIVKSIDDIGVKKEAEQSKEKINDAISVGSAGLAEASDKATTEAVKEPDTTVDVSFDDNKSDKTTTIPVDQMAPVPASVTVAENKSTDLTTKEPAKNEDAFDSKPEDKNIYQNIATEAADNIAAEKSDIAEKPAMPVKKLDYEEMAEIGADGKIISEETEKSEEVDLSNPKGDVKMSAGELANLTKDETDPKKKHLNGMIEKPIEIPNIPDKKKAIQDRLKKLQEESKETEVAKSEDFFKTDDKTEIRDMDNRSLAGDNKATEQIIVPEQSEAKPKLEQDSNKSTSEVEKGPDLTPATPIKPQENQKNDASVTEPIKAITKKANLYKIITGLFRKNKGKEPTANMFSDAEADVLKTREAVVAEEAELMEKKS